MRERTGVILASSINKRIWLNNSSFGNNVYLVEEGADDMTVIIAGGYRCCVRDSFDDVLRKFGLTAVDTVASPEPVP